MTTQGVAGVTAPATTPAVRKVRCGWCIDENHGECAVTVAIIRTGGNNVWRCGCGCDTATQTTRCVTCRRRGVTTAPNSECVDWEDCRAYLAQRRADDPAFQLVDRIKEKRMTTDVQATTDNPEVTVSRTAKPTQPKTGECLCCGGTTKGGKFLPGHDSKYVTQNATQYVDEGKPREVYSRMEALGPALHAKFVKRVGILEAKAAKATAQADPGSETPSEVGGDQ